MRLLTKPLADRVVISEVLGASTALTTPQKVALKAELAKSVYAGKTTSEKVNLLNAWGYGPNPDTQGQVRRPSTIGAVKEWFRQFILPPSTPLKQTWLQKSSIAFAQYTDATVVEINSASFALFAADAVADGIITQADLEAHFPLIPDPLYNSIIQLPSPASVVLGNPSGGGVWMVDDADVLAAEAM